MKQPTNPMPIPLEQLTSERIPELDLYMDQVIQLFSGHYVQNPDHEKVLTKTMINNYAKAKLFPPTKNKKYNKTQIMMMNLIFQLKGTLSLTEIKAALAPFNATLIKNPQENQEFQQFYDEIMALVSHEHEAFTAYLKEQTAKNEAISPIVDPYERELAKIILLTHMSNVTRALAQTLIADLSNQE